MQRDDKPYAQIINHWFSTKDDCFVVFYNDPNAVSQDNVSISTIGYLPFFYIKDTSRNFLEREYYYYTSINDALSIGENDFLADFFNSENYEVYSYTYEEIYS